MSKPSARWAMRRAPFSRPFQQCFRHDREQNSISENQSYELIHLCHMTDLPQSILNAMDRSTEMELDAFLLPRAGGDKPKGS